MFVRIMATFFLMVVSQVSFLKAQDDQKNDQFNFQGPADGFGKNQLTTPFGVTTIDGKSYISMRLQPELAFGKFGVGLDVPLEFSTANGKFRKDEYKGGVGPLRVIRYVRYGVKHQDPVYVRVGDISGSSLGYGLIMYNYSNAVSFDKRKIGANVDLNYEKKFGFEAIYSDFNGFNILGVRPYVRPFQATDVPIIKTTEFGVTYVTDHDKKALYDISEMGADVGVTVLQTSVVQIVPYIQYARVEKNSGVADSAAKSGAKYGAGQGAALGVNFKFNFVADVFNMGVKVERRFFSDNFLPQYFDATYEIGKLSGKVKAIGLIDAKAVQGTYGELFANVIGKIQLLGGLAIPDKSRGSQQALVHIGLAAPDLIPKVVVSGTYDKSNLGKFSDAFKLNQFSIAHVILAYQAYQTGPFVVQAGVDYKWTFERKTDTTPASYKAVKYITPFVGMQLQLPGGGK
jgi:hypothetical protein